MQFCRAAPGGGLHRPKRGGLVQGACAAAAKVAAVLFCVVPFVVAAAPLDPAVLEQAVYGALDRQYVRVQFPVLNDDAVVRSLSALVEQLCLGSRAPIRVQSTE